MSESSRLLDDVTVDSVNLTETLAEHCAALVSDNIPAHVRRFASHCLLDYFAVALAGSVEETGKLVLAEAAERGGHPQADIIGHRACLNVLDAAVVNGTFSHALDYDDVNYAMPGHPTVAVAPAVLALAQLNGQSGAQVIDAFIAGVEIQCRIGLFVTEEQYLRGFHATGTVGTFGAAAACAHLMRLDAQKTTTALGIAAAQAAGLKSLFGTMCKPLHAGKAAANGLYAARLASRGFTSNPDVLECEQGFGRTHSPSTDKAAALDDLADKFWLPNTLFKFHAACYGTQATIDAGHRIRKTHQIDTAQIKRIDLHVPQGNLRMCNIAEPTTGLEAKFSLRHTAAMALTGAPTAAIDAYDEASCRDPNLSALRAKTVVVGEDDLDRAQTDMVVTLDNGVVLRERADMGIPYSDLDAQEKLLTAKFQALVEPILGAAKTEQLYEQLLSFDQVSDIGALSRLTQP